MKVLAAAWLPERASSMAPSVDALFWTLVVLCGGLTVVIALVIGFFCLRYQRGSPAPRESTFSHTTWIEIGWTGATLLAFLGVFFWAAWLYYAQGKPPAGATEIQVIGKQWMWQAQHRNGRRETNELHLLVGQPVKLLMTSQDVIHDFYIPAFRTKQDVVPGRYTAEWFQPTKPGRYHLFCAEYCGMDHSRMGGWIYVLEPTEYAAWLASQTPPESLTAEGERLFVQRGCSGCHGERGVVHAPRLEGLYGRTRPLGDKSFVLADEQYLHDSILQPGRQIAAGYENLMPPYQGQLKEAEVLALVAYLRSLGGTTP